MTISGVLTQGSGRVGKGSWGFCSPGTEGEMGIEACWGNRSQGCCWILHVEDRSTCPDQTLVCEDDINQVRPHLWLQWTGELETYHKVTPSQAYPGQAPRGNFSYGLLKPG